MSVFLQLASIWKIISKVNKFRVYFVIFLSLLASLFEVASIGIIIPFLTVISQPKMLQGNIYIQLAIENFSLETDTQVIIFLTLALICMTLLSGCVRLALSYAQIRSAQSIGTNLSVKLLSKILKLPYELLSKKLSSEIISLITVKTTHVVNQFLIPLLQIFSSILILCFIVSVLIFIQPFVMLLIFSSFSIVYFLIFHFSKNTLFKNSKSINQNMSKVVGIVQESFGNIREIIFKNNHVEIINSFKSADKSLRYGHGYNQFLAASPRFAIEPLGIVILAIVALIISVNGPTNQSAVAQLGAIAIGIQRFLPLMQTIYASSSQIKGGSAILFDLIEITNEPESIEPYENLVRLNFNKSLKFNNVKYLISDRKQLLFEDINLEIQKGQIVGFVGETGSGKSTLIDILSTLIQPTHGFLEVDGVKLTSKNSRSWKDRIAYIPQDIFLINGSIRQNITFGEPLGSTTLERLSLACEISAINDFVRKLPDGLETEVGERGANLSGGQKQRIGIARALFSTNRDILILDEATSALDIKTERRVIENISKINAELTVIMITHRAETLCYCNKVYEVRNKTIHPVLKNGM